MAANSGLATMSGCAFPPGTYKARWEKGRFKVLYEKSGKFEEITFAVLNSAPIPVATSQAQGGGPISEKTLVILSSVPPGAEIEIDGSFVGQTPSSIPLAPGKHSIKLTASGYERWEREVVTVGGEVTIAAKLEQNQK
jgi:hypothetical protein